MERRSESPVFPSCRPTFKVVGVGSFVAVRLRENRGHSKKKRMAASVYVLVAAICMAGRFDWATAAEDDALFSASQVEQLLKNLPLDNLAGVQKMAGRFMKEMAAGQKATDGSDAFQETVLAAMKNQGVLDTWKKRLDAMMYNEVDPDTDEDAFQADADIEEKPQPSVYQPSAVPQSLDAMEKVLFLT